MRTVLLIWMLTTRIYVASGATAISAISGTLKTTANKSIRASITLHDISTPRVQGQQPFDKQFATKLYRAYNRFRAYYGIRPNTMVYLRQDALLGNTPEPCSGSQRFSLGSQPDPLRNNTRAISSSIVCQTTPGRIGSAGQQINAYLNKPQDAGPTNWPMATPYIWSAIEFDSSGNLLPFTSGSATASSNNIQIQPTYWVYRNGTAVLSVGESPLRNFIELAYTSHFVPPF